MKKINYNTLFELMKNGVDLSPYYGAEVVGENDVVLFVIKEKQAISKLISSANIEIVDASGNGISKDDLDIIKERITQALDDETLEKLVFDTGLPKS
jgi:hypothetical protein